ncbi:MAG: 50S ribosomal protein L9 [Parachlamydiales bacterium]|nr:50S ribosomal protein L9 [Parachlamydiales bacterium]
MPSQLLLLEDVDDLGRSGDLVNVKPGFARNFLIPQRKAVMADANAIRMQARLKEERAKKAIEDKKEAEELSAKMANVSIATIVKVDHDGHMYGSVAAYDIVKMLEEKGIVLEKRQVQLAQAIKKTGVHKINLKLKEGVAASLILKIIPEGMDEASFDADLEAKKLQAEKVAAEKAAAAQAAAEAAAQSSEEEEPSEES